MKKPSQAAAKAGVEADSSVLTQLKQLFLVIGGPLVIFAAFRNSLTWHLQRFWGASGDFWQGLWDRVIDRFGEDEFTYYFYGTLIVSTLVYWIWGTMYTLLDITLKPEALRKYKIQPGTNEPVDPKRLRKVMMVVLFNQVFVNVPMAYVGYYLFKWRGIPDIRELPTFHWVLVELVVCLLMEEVGFYYSHRLLHHKWFYRSIHKLHHEWTAPISYTAMYAHPIEHAVSNIAPLLAGPIVCGSHVSIGYLWFAVALMSTCNDHSGYHLPFTTSAEFHDFHHRTFTQNFGAVGLMDRLHNTDSLFRSSGTVKRHKVLTSFTSMRKLYPLPEKGGKQQKRDQ